MAFIIEEKLTTKLLVEILNNGNVLNYTTKKGTNIYQILKENNGYIVFDFNCYGMKILNKQKNINKKDIKEYLKVCIQSHYKPMIFSYHKKRISKKEKNPLLNNEADSKKIIYKWLIENYKESIIIPEFSLGQRRCDYVSFNEKDVTIIEIKSELDSFDRLIEQLDIYMKFAQNVILVIHIKNYIKLLKRKILIHENVGIIILKEDSSIEVIKQSKHNNVSLSSLDTFIGYKEYMGAVKGIKGSSKLNKDQIISFIKNNTSELDKYLYFLNVLKNRYCNESNIRKELFLNGSIEKSIGSAISININRLDHGNDNIKLNEFLDIKH